MCARERPQIHVFTEEKKAGKDKVYTTHKETLLIIYFVRHRLKALTTFVLYGGGQYL